MGRFRIAFVVMMLSNEDTLIEVEQMEVKIAGRDLLGLPSVTHNKSCD